MSHTTIGKKRYYQMYVLPNGWVLLDIINNNLIEKSGEMIFFELH